MIRYGQIHNPDTQLWVKIDQDSGAVMGESPRQFAGIPVVVRDSFNYEPPKKAKRQPNRDADPMAAVRSFGASAIAWHAGAPKP